MTAAEWVAIAGIHHGRVVDALWSLVAAPVVMPVDMVVRDRRSVLPPHFRVSIGPLLAAVEPRLTPGCTGVERLHEGATA